MEEIEKIETDEEIEEPKEEPKEEIEEPKEEPKEEMQNSPDDRESLEILKRIEKMLVAYIGSRQSEEIDEENDEEEEENENDPIMY